MAAGFPGMTPDRMERFTYRALVALRAAHDAAVEMNHPTIGTEHLLLGVCSMEEGAASVAMRNLGAEPADVRSRVRLELEDVPAAPGGEIGLDPDAETALDATLAEADRLGHTHVGTEHILLGLLAEAGSAAAVTLRSFSIELEGARDEVVRVLSTWSPGSMGRMGKA
jgi:ATP-dependent Clp protease ATP-binding subunit ClpC